MNNESTPPAAGTETTHPGGDDPEAIRSIAVTVDDVVTGLEANLRADRNAVLRITPPFYGRMRARIHVAGGEGDYEGPAPIHIDPATLIDSVPPYPTADETAAELSTAEPNSDQHRRKHTELLDHWRATVRSRLVEETTITTPAGRLEIAVLALGGSPADGADE